jgi:hypothetical protein
MMFFSILWICFRGLTPREPSRSKKKKKEKEKFQLLGLKTPAERELEGVRATL